MNSSPARNTLPAVTVIPPSLPRPSLRPLSTASQAPIMVPATLVAVELHSSPNKPPRKSEIIGHVTPDAGFLIRDAPRSDSVVLWRKSVWTETAIDASAIAREEIALARGISASVKLLLSVSLWMTLLRYISVLLAIVLVPFNRSRKHRVLAVEGEDKEEMRKGIENDVDLEVLARRDMAIERVREDEEDSGKTKREFSLFVTPRGVTLFTQSWTPVSDEIKGLVLVLHGLNEHSGRYSEFAKELNAEAFKVYGIDWIGHGGSDGLHGYVNCLDDVVSDTKAFLDDVLARNPGIPCFCFGHSTGGAILLEAVLDPEVEGKINGLILTSPAIGVQASHPIYTILAPIVSVLIPRYQLSAAYKRGAVVSRDPEALVAKYSDPLVYTGSLRVRTGYEILRTSKHLKQNMSRFSVPFLVLHGTADVITNPKASEKLYSEASSPDKTIKLYEGLLHDLLFEPERDIVVHDIVKWLSERT